MKKIAMFAFALALSAQICNGQIKPAGQTGNIQQCLTPPCPVRPTPTPIPIHTPTPTPTPVSVAGSWAPTGGLGTTLTDHRATLLSNGSVLISGGTIGTNLSSNMAEIYNPATGRFTTANMTIARDDHTATALSNGTVLIAGGRDSSTGNDLASAELYSNGTFIGTGDLKAARRAASAILLQNGNALIVGGTNTVAVLNSAEVYNPSTGTFSLTGTLNTARARAALALLPSGLVLVAGGNNQTQFSSAELFNPSTGTFTNTGSMNVARTGHTATMLQNGTVLVVGGSNSTSFSLNTAEIYNPATGAFTLTGNLNVGREIHSATLLPNGMVLIAGGVGANGPLDSAELYNPATGTFSLTGTLNSERYAHTATLLNNGAVLVVGGQDYFQTSSGLTVELLRSAETFVPQLRVLTSHNDHKRTGQNTLETALTPGNIRGLGNFGKLFSQPVDGYIYAQPLYVSNLAIPGNGTHNVVFVATEGDSVYAFDADGNSGANASPLWHASLLDAAHGATAGETTVDANNDDHCGNILPQIGITSTPVIDPNTNTIYVVAKSKQPGPPVKFVYRLHALDLTTGAEKFQGPVVIQASIPGNGAGSVNGTVTFNPPTQTNRAGLLFLDGTIYIGFASTCDISPYHGWLYSYDATTLAQQGVFNTTPNTTSGSSPSGYGAGGIWMAGSGLTADSEGNIFLATGNGDFDATVGDYGDSILKFSTTGNLPTLTDYFTPTDEFALFKGDVDLGSGGVVLIPNQPGNMHLLVQAGKEGIVYVVNRDQMTSNNLHFCSGCATESMIVQELGQEQTSGKSAVGGMWGKPVYWNNTVYFWGNGDQLKAFPMSNGLLGSPLTTNEAIHGYPGESLWVSSNGTANGILWSIETDSGVEVLKAYDAVNLTPLYSSANSSTDNPGGPVKFAIPVVVNGKVYVGAQNQLSIFGSTL